jgi:hypothetical protein
MAVSIRGAVLNASALGPRLPIAFAVLGAAALLAITISSLGLTGRRTESEPAIAAGAHEPR